MSRANTPRSLIHAPSAVSAASATSLGTSTSGMSAPMSIPPLKLANNQKSNGIEIIDTGNLSIEQIKIHKLKQSQNAYEMRKIVEKIGQLQTSLSIEQRLRDEAQSRDMEDEKGDVGRFKRKKQLKETKN